jgi:hypothetical protein
MYSSKVVHLWRHTPQHSGGKAYYESIKVAQRLIEQAGFEFEPRSTRSGDDLCSQVRLFSNLSVLITAHGQQLANTVFMPESSLLVEVYPKGYAVAGHDTPSMFYWQNRDSGIRHHVVQASGDRNNLGFDVPAIVSTILSHLKGGDVVTPPPIAPHTTIDIVRKDQDDYETEGKQPPALEGQVTPNTNPMTTGPDTNATDADAPETETETELDNDAPGTDRAAAGGGGLGAIAGGALESIEALEFRPTR